MSHGYPDHWAGLEVLAEHSAGAREEQRKLHSTKPNIPQSLYSIAIASMELPLASRAEQTYQEDTYMPIAIIVHGGAKTIVPGNIEAEQKGCK